MDSQWPPGSLISRRDRRSWPVSQPVLFSEPQSGMDIIPLPTRLTDNFAIELYDCILQHFHDSNDILSNFSLVCQSFLPLCRRHLFHSLTLRPSLAEEILASPHAMKTVVPYVKDFALGGHWMTGTQQFQAVVPLVQSLIRPVKLHLETWSLDHTSAVSLPTSLSNHYETLLVLDLKYIRFPSYTLFVHFLSQFVELEELSLNNVTWDVMDGPPTTTATTTTPDETPRLPDLEKLSIVSCDNAAILSWLFPNLLVKSSSFISTRLSSLHLPETVPCEAPMITALLKAIGPALHDLELGVLPHVFSVCEPTPSIHEDALQTIDLSGNTNLRTLGIRQLSLYRLPPQPNSLLLAMDNESPYQKLAFLLSTISSPHLEILTFHIWLSEEWHLDWMPWAGITEALFGTCNLRRMGIRAFGVNELEGNVKAWIAKRLDSELLASMLDVTLD